MDVQGLARPLQTALEFEHTLNVTYGYNSSLSLYRASTNPQPKVAHLCISPDSCRVVPLSISKAKK